MAERMTIEMNGSSHTIAVDDSDTPLRYALRNELGLNHPHFDCGLAPCGACTVLLGATPTSPESASIRASPDPARGNFRTEAYDIVTLLPPGGARRSPGRGAFPSCSRTPSREC